MRWGPVITVLACVGLAGWFAPALRAPGSRDAPAGSEMSAPSATMVPAVSTAPAAAGDDLVLPRAEDGHFYTQGLVEGQPVRFMVDTGASVVALTGPDAQAAGLEWHEDDVAHVGQGAGGVVEGVRVRLDHLELGDMEARDVDAVIIPEGLPVSLLGQSFLRDLQHVGVDGDRMVLTGR